MNEPSQPSSQRIRIEHVAAWLFTISILVVCLDYFSSFFQPVVLAGILWYLIYVLKAFTRRIRIRGKKLPEWLLTTLAFVVIFLVIFGIVEIVTHNLELIIARSPVYIKNSQQIFQNIEMYTFDGFEDVQERIYERLNSFDFRPILTGLLNGLSGFAGNFFMIIIYVGFLLAEESAFKKKLHLVVEVSRRPKRFSAMIGEVNDAIRTYVLVKTQMSLLTGILSYIILVVFGVDFPVLWAFLIFLLNYIPYIGSFVATLLPAAFAVFQFQALSMFFWVFVVIESVQVVVGNVIEPKVMGKTLNLSPLGVLLALTFWGILWGVLGMIISVPITSIMVIVASRIPSLRFLAIWLSETGELNHSSTSSQS